MGRGIGRQNLASATTMALVDVLAWTQTIPARLPAEMQQRVVHDDCGDGTLVD